MLLVRWLVVHVQEDVGATVSGGGGREVRQERPEGSERELRKLQPTRQREGQGAGEGVGVRASPHGSVTSIFLRPPETHAAMAPVGGTGDT